MKVLVVKDREGNLRPGFFVHPMSSDALVNAIRAEWKETMSKKKEYRECTLVEAELTEL